MIRRKWKWSYVYLGLIVLAMYIPIFVVIVYSFNESKISTVWSGVSLKWYKMLFQDRSMKEALVNSLVLGGLSSAFAGLIATAGAVGMAGKHFRLKGLVEYVATLPIMIPEIILGMVFLSYFSLLKLPFGMLTLVIAHTAFSVPYVYMQVKAGLNGIDPALVEAARDMGASSIRAFRDVTFPLIMPSVVAGMLLSFAMSFDDVVISVFVTGATVNTLPVKIYSQMKTGVTPEANALCAVIFACSLVIVAIALLLGRVRRR